MEILSFIKMLFLVTIMTIMLGNMAKSELHYVGGNKTSWSPKANLTAWSRHEHFHVGDWLYFGYDKHKFSVLEVNKPNYDKCLEKGFIRNITKGGGRDVYHLAKAKTYYFISGGRACWEGLKVAINVTTGTGHHHDAPAPPPHHNAPTPAPVSPNGSASYARGIYQTLVLVLVLMWAISSDNIIIYCQK